ncbi:acyltransferase, WS/DGAT/MGAT [Polaribacter sp. Hel1_33_78]|uniref:WS/DGAT/MGAT family O-acyltransferase n=1 Tax=unclassified Polaribacter TaxID=196858 RepID=UPI00087CDBD1|nr:MULTISPECIES: wax ester/triacylglycerol synthase family O-acyltransferase [unclassified Polaribacter]MDG1402423.1 wax ester/triacylglycerol synthase family O-acyltransferase [Polaribacter sp.]MDG2435808.1 wax ester/triacylglycerol synthase family O-acyltransferase [Polaribacter sp.]SDT95804.1 acyltransferase, WS/DGAT/MGAT [Polaribacter sp. Hel1_33_78]
MAKKIIKDLLQDALDVSIQQVSGQDATFLYAESPSSPMHVATLTIVEGSIEFNDFKEIVASKLHLIPKFRKRLLNVPLNLDYPYWVDDPNFDIDLHINRLKLPDPSNWKTLREMTSAIFSSPLDLRRPLWSISFIEGLDEVSQVPKGSIAIVSKIHHVMIDGSSGVGIMGILFDKNKEDKNKKPAPTRPYEPEPLPDGISLLLKSSYGFFKNPLKVPKLIGETAFSLLKGKMKSQLNSKKSIHKNSFSTPKTIFNESVSPRRTWGTAILAFDRINTLRKIMDVSVNDLILAICAGGIRKYLEEKEKLPVQPLVANVPISIRVKGDKQKMDNQISNMLVKIATHIKDPIKRLEYIQEQTNMGKSRHKAVGAKALSKMADAVPFGLANLAAGLYTRYNIKEFHRPPFNVTITNVPGPQNPLYLKGHKIVGIFGLTPVLDGFGLIIAAFSYNGIVSITTTSDAKTMPDADKFSRYIRESANELEKIILTKGKQKTTTKIEKKKSMAFFSAFKKFLNEHEKLREQAIGQYDFQLDLNKNEANYQLEVLKDAVAIRKKKTVKPLVKIEIEDTTLFNLYKKKLLLEEVLIQERIKLSGTKKNTEKLTQLLSKFLEN